MEVGRLRPHRRADGVQALTSDPRARAAEMVVGSHLHVTGTLAAEVKRGAGMLEKAVMGPESKVDVRASTGTGQPWERRQAVILRAHRRSVRKQERLERPRT